MRDETRKNWDSVRDTTKDAIHRSIWNDRNSTKFVEIVIEGTKNGEKANKNVVVHLIYWNYFYKHKICRWSRCCKTAQYDFQLRMTELFCELWQAPNNLLMI